MRWFWLAAISVTSLAAGDGLSPKAQPSDYPVHESVKSAAIAAAIVPRDEVKKMFSGEIAKLYIVIEVAFYPQGSLPMDVNRMDFALKTADRDLHASNPRDVANPYHETKGQFPSRGPNVTTETGVIVARAPDPVTGQQRTSVGTYEGVAVSNYPRPNDPAPPSNGSQNTAGPQIRDKALPEGSTSKAVAGYLYFRYSEKKRDSLVLNYTNDDGSVDLKFPK